MKLRTGGRVAVVQRGLYYREVFALIIVQDDLVSLLMHCLTLSHVTEQASEGNQTLVGDAVNLSVHGWKESLRS